jgi:hypothetical protein
MASPFMHLQKREEGYDQSGDQVMRKGFEAIVGLEWLKM